VIGFIPAEDIVELGV